MAGIRGFLKARPLAGVLGLAIAFALPVQVWAVVARDAPRAKPRPLATWSPPPLAQPEPSKLATRKPKPSPTPTKTKAAAPVARRTPSRLNLFAGLGAWVDVYDFRGLDPVASIEVMRANRVRTLYIQTGRYNTPHAVAPEVDAWLEAAHAKGIEVVGWYLPSYKNLNRDVERMVAVASYRSAGGERFDGAGIDIESRAEVRDVATWNERVAEHARLVRAQLPKRYPLTAITPPPLGMAVAPQRWFGFPWRALSQTTDVIMLMSYWSFRHDCDEKPLHCAYAYTYENVKRARALTGDAPVHVIGGVGDAIDAREVGDFARGARAARAFGASLYDFDTTRADFWGFLRKLATL